MYYSKDSNFNAVGWRKYMRVGQSTSPLVEGLYENQLLKFNNYVLSNGQSSPVFIDMVKLAAEPRLFEAAVDLYDDTLDENDKPIFPIRPEMLSFAGGLAYTGAHSISSGIAEGVASGQGITLIEGLLVSDAPSRIKRLKEKIGEVNVKGVVALIDAEQGAKEELESSGISVLSGLTLSAVMLYAMQNKLAGATPEQYVGINDDILRRQGWKS